MSGKTLAIETGTVFDDAIRLVCRETGDTLMWGAERRARQEDGICLKALYEAAEGAAITHGARMVSDYNAGRYRLVKESGEPWSDAEVSDILDTMPRRDLYAVWAVR